MTDTPTPPKTVHPAHRISTFILLILICIGGIAYGAYSYAKGSLTGDGYYTLIFGKNPLVQTTDQSLDDLERQAREDEKQQKKKAAHVHTVSDVPAPKPTVPVVQQ